MDLAIGAGVQMMVDIPAATAGVPAFDLARRMGALDACLFAGETREIRRAVVDGQDRTVLGTAGAAR